MLKKYYGSLLLISLLSSTIIYAQSISTSSSLLQSVKTPNGIYYIGKVDDGNLNSGMFINYNDLNNKVLLPQLPDNSPQIIDSSCSLYNNKLIVCLGGRTINNDQLNNSLLVFDIETFQWQSTPLLELPSTIKQSTITSSTKNNGIYVYGGYFKSQHFVFNGESITQNDAINVDVYIPDVGRTIRAELNSTMLTLPGFNLAGRLDSENITLTTGQLINRNGNNDTITTTSTTLVTLNLLDVGPDRSEFISSEYSVQERFSTPSDTSETRMYQVSLSDFQGGASGSTNSGNSDQEQGFVGSFRLSGTSSSSSSTNNNDQVELEDGIDSFVPRPRGGSCMVPILTTTTNNEEGEEFLLLFGAADTWTGTQRFKRRYNEVWKGNLLPLDQDDGIILNDGIVEFSRVEYSQSNDSLPIPRGESACDTFGETGQVVAFGGITDDGPSNDVWVLDGISFQWRRLFENSISSGNDDDDDVIPTPRGSSTANVVGNMLVVVGGGGDDDDDLQQQQTSKLYFFDMCSNQWVSTPDSLDPNQGGCGLSPAGIAGIVIGCLVFVLIIGVLLFYWRKRKTSGDPFYGKKNVHNDDDYEKPQQFRGGQDDVSSSPHDYRYDVNSLPLNNSSTISATAANNYPSFNSQVVQPQWTTNVLSSPPTTTATATANSIKVQKQHYGFSSGLSGLPVPPPPLPLQEESPPRRSTHTTRTMDTIKTTKARITDDHFDSLY